MIEIKRTYGLLEDDWIVLRERDDPLFWVMQRNHVICSGDRLTTRLMHEILDFIDDNATGFHISFHVSLHNKKCWHFYFEKLDDLVGFKLRFGGSNEDLE